MHPRPIAIAHRAVLLAALALPGCAFVVADLNPFAARPQALEEHVVEGEGRAKILVVDISHVISDEERGGTLGIAKEESVVARVTEELRQAGDDDRVQAVVLRINSPGGSVTASDTLYHVVRDFKAKKPVPVVAQLMDLGTSGAYYVALSTDEIVAQPTTVTGSIGVIMFNVDLAGLLDKVGVKDRTLKAGTYKDIGSPLRPMTSAEKQILQSVLDDMRGRFVQLVREGRPQANAEMFSVVTDGRIITAGQALQAGLIDRIGYLDDAIGVAKQRAGLTEARVILYRRGNEFSENIYSKAGTAPAQVNLINFDLSALASHGPAFMYLWQPQLGE
ncbi:MAG TPA: signal peptide peptidase SppA [Candidatus Margulisiibacteriota bacterium]|nr:signal peptide peptidase SppA [Candidatus Margulisiibacteriota bacterium]